MNFSDTFFDSAYRGNAPWDIGAPQPDMLALLDTYPPESPALDVGCGTGALALALARRGLTVVGVDLAAGAIEQAQAELAAEPALKGRVEFRVADAFQLDSPPGSFRTVVDTGFYHLFGAHAREALVKELTALVAPRGRYYLLGFAQDWDTPNSPHKVTESELREMFSAARGWRELDVHSGQFRTHMGSLIPAVAACVERVSSSS